MRVVAIAKSISSQPRYLDVGCGYGDFLEKVREFIPNAIGIEKDDIFYNFNMIKPDYIYFQDASLNIDDEFDVIFVGWMDPGIDFRKNVADKTEVVITTLDEGISLAAEYEDQGFQKIAEWRTPSWEDMNIELMNRYYTRISKNVYRQLSDLRGAHNLWYVYCRNPQNFQRVRASLRGCLRQELLVTSHYNFESVMDDCGFGYLEQLSCVRCKIKLNKLWEVIFT
ncbi:MAG: class I SAM-dependent methyltransferase, partial [Thermoproteota archaeon]|nr:class I SAM-dependent methyltransferase [Thermoproteota archaeon]